MLPDSRPDPQMPQVLFPLLPSGVPPEAFFSAETLTAFQDHWRELEALGFELEVRPNNLRIRHGNRQFDFVIQFSDQDDLGERRRLFAALRASFGTVWDTFTWFFRPNPAVTSTYRHLKGILGTCQAARLHLRRVT